MVQSDTVDHQQAISRITRKEHLPRTSGLIDRQIVRRYSLVLGQVEGPILVAASNDFLAERHVLGAVDVVRVIFGLDDEAG